MEGKTTIITGGAGDIAGAITKAFAENGGSVALVDVAAEKAKARAEAIAAAYGVKARAYALDITDIDALVPLFDKIEEEMGNVNFLVNAAGIVNTITYRDMTGADWDKLIGVNLKGPFFFTREILFRMKEQSDGHIINFGSIAGERGAKYSGPHYSISKAGIICLTKMLAKLVEDSGVTVSTVSPGIIVGFMANTIGSQVYSYDIPMNRMGTPEEVVGTVLYHLASSLSDYITGQNISVNGGQSMR